MLGQGFGWKGPSTQRPRSEALHAVFGEPHRLVLLEVGQWGLESSEGLEGGGTADQRPWSWLQLNYASFSPERFFVWLVGFLLLLT